MRDRKVTRPGSLATAGVGHVGLRTSNLERSRAFYEELLGLTERARKPGVLRIRSGKDLLVLYEKGYGGSDIHFGFKVRTPEEVDRWKDWLESKQISIYEDETEEGRRSIKIRDPDGHWIEIFAG